MVKYFFLLLYVTEQCSWAVKLICISIFDFVLFNNYICVLAAYIYIFCKISKIPVILMYITLF